ncbi:MAG TPA: hypothetical protein H9713_07970 [Candidatus Mediterraneibacter surreyensis]|jgi:hypothetical protein|nr:hypothetical protein [Candidatus Mediterraneibacter surreyensis]
MIYENNEEKRSTIWRTILTVSSVLIIIILVFFIVKLFTGNPLEGTWVDEDSGNVLVIRDNGELSLTLSESDDTDETFTAEYDVDTKTKVLTVRMENDVYAEDTLSGTYSYNIEQDTLTLTEREYGDQLVFVRK